MSAPDLPFSPATADWFARSFPAPTPAQTGAWEAIDSGAHALVVAPTGSGKTLAAFLHALDRCFTTGYAEKIDRCRVVYVSPLKALAADVERNLRSPLVGIGHSASRLGAELAPVLVGTRTGDTPARERRLFAASPPDILITTPESLYLMLTSSARAGFAGVHTVIVDEIHALASSKRGSHLAVSLERLDALLPVPAQRIGLSATVRDPVRVATFLTGHRSTDDGGRRVRIVHPPSSKRIDMRIEVPIPDLANPPPVPPSAAPGESSPAVGGWPAAAPTPASEIGRPADPRDMPGSIWPHLTSRLVDLITAHSSTIVFTNSRRGAERLTARINDEAAHRFGPDTVLARAHHGSMSHVEREVIETALKAGQLPAVVATSSLELGIDMGAVDLVVQVGSPGSVASALQRIGRAGHQVGADSVGVVLPTHVGDLLPAAVIAQRARAGLVEHTHPPANPLDVLAQHVVSITATGPTTRADIAALVRRSEPFHSLTDAALEAVLDMLAGRYPSEDFAELRPRITWNRITGEIEGRSGVLQLATTSGGTIPDRGMYGVFLVGDSGGGRRVGELDEEMVFESRAGDLFTLGSSTWRIEQITPDRVLVVPAPGAPGRLPFWKGDAPARPAELGAALGEMVRRAQDEGLGESAIADWGLSDWAGDNLLRYLRDQVEATGTLPTDTTIVVEKFRDELGDWRLVVHSPFGAAVHAPWALVVATHLRETYGIDAAAMHSDDGIVFRLPDADPFDPLASFGDGGAARANEVGVEDLILSPAELTERVVAALAGSAHFASRFREAAARSLLLPRRRPNQRQPLWQQRLRSAQLLQVAAAYPQFPVVLEAVRECVQDDFDVPALTDLMRRIAARQVRVVEVSTPAPSPFAKSLLFGYVAQFLYDGDTPLAERRAAALTLDPGLLADLLGDGLEIADLLDPEAIASVEAEVGLRTYPLRGPDDLHDLLRRVGPLTRAQLAEFEVARDPGATPPHAQPDAEPWLETLQTGRRVLEIHLAGESAWGAAEDAARLRDGLGLALPPGIAAVFLEPVPEPLTDLVRRFARRHGPFRAQQVAARYGLPVGAINPVLTALVADQSIVAGNLRPDTAHTPQTLAMAGPDYCDADVLRRIRRRSLAALRAQVEAVDPATFAVFLGQWHQLGTLRGVEGTAAAVDTLAGTPVAASALEPLILAARVPGYRPTDLDELTSSGEVTWVGAGAIGATDGWVRVLPAHLVADLTPEPGPVTGLAAQVLELMTPGTGWFARDLLAASGATPSDLSEALWELVWAGHLTNDTLAPLRARLAARPRSGVSAAAPPRARGRFLTLRAMTRAPLLEPDTAGRWSRLPQRSDPSQQATATALTLADRDGVVLRGSVPADLPGGFGTVYRVLAHAEEAGAVRRGYFVEGLGASQFAVIDAVDRLRASARTLAESESAPVSLLAASDPANPYGAGLPWPGTGGHRPGRKVGASVVLVAGELVLYLERGAKSLLVFNDELAAPAVGALAEATRAGKLGRYIIAKINGESALGRSPAVCPASEALQSAGFVAHPRGLRLDPPIGAGRA